MTVNRKSGVRPLEAAKIMLLDPSTVTRLVVVFPLLVEKRPFADDYYP